MSGGRLAICVIGAGPRGLSVVERICANERAERRHNAVLVHVVDPDPPTDRSRHLLMNTVASQVTVYTDATSRIEGPIDPGPSLYEWAKAGDGTLAEARDLGPDDYPTRALHGRYLRDTFRRVVRSAPAHLAFRVHGSRAVALADIDGVTGGRQGIRLADGTRVHDLDAVVLALGNLPALPTPAEARAASLARIHHLRYVPSANPGDVDLSAAGPGETVLLRGLGLTFFDYVRLLTTGRGGTFEGNGDDLVYRPSGKEPRLVALPHPAHLRTEPDGRHTPASRIAELIALIHAGVVELTGPGTEARIDPGRGCFTAVSRAVPGRPVHARVLIEARPPGSDIRRTADPLLRFLLDTKQAAPCRPSTADGGAYETGGLAVTGRPYHLVDGAGRTHPRRFAFGGRPLADSVTLGDSDAIARATLRLSPLHPPRRADHTDNGLTGMIV
ncbi:FAD/NAD(P)-binding protein [Actinoplanes sp. NPDC049668]|uniref:FAD/NAD(P)-binding protein n=1 Tax=unclassified Actinoplanes TaxID=2626549 RepID=UPI0033AC8DF7